MTPGRDELATLPGRDLDGLSPIVAEAPRAPGLVAALRAGVAMGRQRLLRRPVALLGLLGLALTIVGALIERRAGTAGAVDRALTGTFRLVIPLVTFGVTGEAWARTRLRDAAWPASRFGLPGREVALGSIGAGYAAVALMGALLAAVSVLVAYAPSETPLAVDVVLSAWIGALTALAYAGWFAFGSTFFRRGGGRWLALVLDFAAGGSTGVVGALLPRANARNLLGGVPPLDLPQLTSSLLLAAMALGLGAAAAWRSRD